MPEWREHYVRYSHLKQMLKDFVAANKEANSASYVPGGGGAGGGGGGAPLVGDQAGREGGLYPLAPSHLHYSTTLSSAQLKPSSGAFSLAALFLINST